MKNRLILALSLVLCVFSIWSCGTEEGPNLPPETTITKAALQDTARYRIDMAWSGTDPDGRVAFYEIAWHDGMVYSGTYDNLAWQHVEVTESTFTVAADSCTAAGQPCHHSHTFFVRAVDNDGARDRLPASESFDATTIRPRSRIVRPEPGGGFGVTLPTCVTIGWDGTDQDGKVVQYRYGRKKYEDTPWHQPPDFNDKTRWSSWSTAKLDTISLDPTDPEDPWSFYVQAKDNAGAVEEVFDDGRNHIVVFVDDSLDSKPSVRICATQGSCSEIGGPSIECRTTADTAAMHVPINVTAGDRLCFSADQLHPGRYATKVTHIAFLENDPGKPGSWRDATKDENLTYPEGDEIFTVQVGMNYVFVWVKDDYCEFGSTNMAYIIINGISAQ